MKYSISTHGFFRGLIFSFKFFIPKILGSEYYKSRLNSLEKNSIDNAGESVGCISWFMAMEEVFPLQWFEERELMSFEEKEFWAPKEYDNFLKRSYGNYMQLPPEKDRMPHHDYVIVKNYDK